MFKLILIISGLILSFPLFNAVLENQVNAREKTFDKGIENESRFKETEVLWNERLNSDSQLIFLIGEKPFDSVGEYGNGVFGDRPLHVDINIVLFSIGFLGLFLYTLFYLSLVLKFLNYTIKLRAFKRDKDLQIFKFLFLSSVSSLIALSFSGGLNGISFRMFGFFIMALSLGQINFFFNKKLHKIK